MVGKNRQSDERCKISVEAGLLIYLLLKCFAKQRNDIDSVQLIDKTSGKSSTATLVPRLLSVNKN